ncbi:GPW/gp25 family protein [Sorangium sp. So ce131]|uniref:GPW/gp25 family protein n=1 Tax=Sorangium sp. So ce131 TaxID=3133282 RepID=UPI003F5EF516
MTSDDRNETSASFLGTGLSFPPEFVRESGQVLMTSDEEDIERSLRILFGTARGERFLAPKYGLDLREVLFEAMSTTMRTFLAERVRTAILIYEPRINVLSLRIDGEDANDGALRIAVDYEVRATNSRYNLVFPFYRTDGNEVRASVDALPP